MGKSTAQAKIHDICMKTYEGEETSKINLKSNIMCHFQVGNVRGPPPCAGPRRQLLPRRPQRNWIHQLRVSIFPDLQHLGQNIRLGLGIFCR